MYSISSHILRGPSNFDLLTNQGEFLTGQLVRLSISVLNLLTVSLSLRFDMQIGLATAELNLQHVQGTPWPVFCL